MPARIGSTLGCLVRADADEDSDLFRFFQSLIECVESARVEVTDKNVEEFGILDQYLEPLKEVLPVFVCDERPIGMSSHRLSLMLFTERTNVTRLHRAH